MSSLSKISRPIKNELEQFEDIFKSAMRSDVGIVDLVARYIIRQKGKKIRPILVLLSAKISGGITERTFRGANLVELLHTATLIHDDVVDNADKRRGIWSINAIFKNKVAVLMGDYLLSRGLMISVEGKDYDFLKVITEAVKRMSEGELLQIQKTRKLDIDEETYFKVISDKTASLLETCCLIGAMSTTDDSKCIEAMRQFGHSLGMAFQIRDDILDYEGTTNLIGKPVGGDIKEKKITLPLIYALNKVSKSEAARIKSVLKNGNDKTKVKEIIGFVKANNGIDYALEVSRSYSIQAKDALNIFPESEMKSSLINLIDFVTQREN
ncbi:MAG: polyprenyl synthetase family protein [Ignavibacteriota bacterium]|jgi:octaprenyl-diphosphate synthase|nr:polyprenyl synthetase family protein [Ignavibacteriota bacterium]MCO6446107.1 polyprenyl synthetase family protein [Ignavibacterium album]MCZ2267626.1 polyprenyl synthetase family protein [Ignavibacteriales bacterium]MDD5607763.1 polyprenyl synthetase family protein [Ignavibacterium sp.]MDX9712985.1 polyprenyl synthetase family protein [Ignavibacteriaceae bacterium]